MSAGPYHMRDLSTVEKVYSGKLGACMCGCAGKYSYTVEAASTHFDREYLYVSDRSTRAIVNKVLFNLDEVVQCEWSRKQARPTADVNFVYVEDKTAGKIRVIYFKPNTINSKLSFLQWLSTASDYSRGIERARWQRRWTSYSQFDAGWSD